MLLPSALSCDSRPHHHNHNHSSQQYHHNSQHPARSRFPPTRLFATTPPSPSTYADGFSFIASNGLLGTCRALQSLLNSSSSSSSSHRLASLNPTKQAQTQTHAQLLQSPLHVVRPAHGMQARAHKVVKRQRQLKNQVVQRGVNKRRRDVYEGHNNSNGDGGNGERRYGFWTPKRRRRVPGEQEMPLGIGREEFRLLEMLREEEEGEDENERVDGAARLRSRSRSGSLAQPQPQPQLPEIRGGEGGGGGRGSCAVENGEDGRCRCRGRSARSGDVNNDDDDNDDDDDDDHIYSVPPSPTATNTTTSTTSDWTSEDDKRLVELVLEKLKLSRRDWNECARRMGKDHDSVGRRWRALVGEGNVGLRRGGM
ncbi:hypothetical protein ACJ73_10200, partial [Blastomyces percursus]